MANWWEPYESDGKAVAQPHSTWDRFKDEYMSGALHSPFGGEGVARAYLKYIGGHSDEEINAAEKRLSDHYAQRHAEDPAFNGGSLQQGVVKGGIDLLGNMLGGVDPSYAIAPGRNAVQRIAAQGGINAGMDAASQGVELHRGVRDKFDPYEMGLNLLAGVGIQGTGEAFARAKTGRMLNEGMKHPEWKEVNNIIVKDLEGGGTEAHPNVSKKGAMGPQQVMPETARDPGFGIRPWNGKTQEDLSRVGRQYSAAMMRKYRGDVSKVLAAYNGGPGRVDGLIKKYGGDWFQHLPNETKAYVVKGVDKFHPRQAEEFAAGTRSYYDPHEKKYDDTLALHDKFEQEASSMIDELQSHVNDMDKVVDLHDVRIQKTLEPIKKQLDVFHQQASEVLEYIKDGNSPLTLDEVNEFRDMMDRSISGKWMPPEMRAHAEDVKSMWDEAAYRLGEKPPVLDSMPDQKYVNNIADQGPPKPANDPNKPGFIQNFKNMLADDSAGLSGDNDNIHNIADARQKKELKDFHAKLTGQVRDGAKASRILGQRIKDQGLLSFNVGDRFTTPKGRTLKQGPWKVVGYYADSKNPERYGYWVERGQKDVDLERTVMLVSDPVADAKFKERGMKDWNRADEVAGWQKQGIVRRLLDDDSGAYRDPFDKLDTSKNYDELDPEGKLIKAVREARPISAEQRSLHRAARSERSGHIDKIQQEGRGLKGYHEQLKALKGSLPKADYESIAEHFSEEDVSHLLNKINNSRSLLPLEKVKTQTALMKLLGSDGAKAPTAGDIKLLSQVYSEDFVTALMDNREFMQKFWHGVGSTINIPRALMASYDLSAPLRQGIFFIGKKEYWKSFGHMFKLFGSEDASKALMENIRSRPSWAMMKKAGLAISDPHSHFLADREEAFMTDYAEKIPLAGLGVKASNRAYSGFLNKLRADVFDDYVKQYENIGVNLASDPKKLKEVASFINAATGRGSLGKWGNPAAPALASVFFSPRLIASRAQMFYPGTYIRTDPILRKEAIKSLLSFGAVALSVAGLTKYGLGLGVETDPTSADFMKIKMGNTRFDILGGFQQYIRLGAELATGKATSGSGAEHDLTSGKFGQDTRRDVLEKFIINKFSPVASFFSDMLEGKNAVGQKFDVKRHNLDLGEDSLLKNDIMSRFVPLVIQDMADGIQEYGPAGAAVSIPGIFGVGVQTYKPKEPKSKAANWWREFEPKKEKASTASTDWWKEYEK